MAEAKILSGKDVASSVYNKLNKRILSLSGKGIRPGLCVVLIGNDPASQIYVRTKTKKLKSLGLLSEAVFLPKDVSEEKVIKIINDLNNDTQLTVPDILLWYQLISDPDRKVSGCELFKMDFNSDSNLNVIDLVQIVQHVNSNRRRS